MEFFKIRRVIPFMRHAKVFNIISALTFVAAVVLLATKGLHFSIEFTGGTVMEASYGHAAEPERIRAALNKIGLNDISVQTFGASSDVLIRLPLKAAEGESQNVQMQKQADAVVAALKADDPTAQLKRVEFVGSQVGNTTVTTDAVYRVTVQMDNGAMRYYDVPASGDLRIGDRVRVDNGVIYRG